MGMPNIASYSRDDGPIKNNFAADLYEAKIAELEARLAAAEQREEEAFRAGFGWPKYEEDDAGNRITYTENFSWAEYEAERAKREKEGEGSK